MLLDHLFKAKLKSNDQRDQSRWISACKALSWRIVGTLDTLVISLIVTGRIDLALAIGGIEIVSKMILFYIHERAWLRITKAADGKSAR